MPNATNSWSCHRLHFRAFSDICIGFDRLGFVQRTRYYIPGRNLWAAATVALAAKQTPPAYVAAGATIGENFRFSPLFILDENSNYVFPWAMGVREFEYRYIGSRGRTSIKPESASALDNSLFDMEFIAAHDGHGKPTHFGGCVWVKAGAERTADLNSLLAEIAVGADRHYGMGRLRLESLANETTPFGCALAPTHRVLSRWAQPTLSAISA